ncbi:hypothetical protein M3J09_009680 [Ascochyta lentis]
MCLAPTSRCAEGSGFGATGCRRPGRGGKCTTGREAVALWGWEMKPRRSGVLD